MSAQLACWFACLLALCLSAPAEASDITGAVALDPPTLAAHASDAPDRSPQLAHGLSTARGLTLAGTGMIVGGTALIAGGIAGAAASFPDGSGIVGIFGIVSGALVGLVGVPMLVTSALYTDGVFRDADVSSARASGALIYTGVGIGVIGLVGGSFLTGGGGGPGGAIQIVSLAGGIVLATAGGFAQLAEIDRVRSSLGQHVSVAPTLLRGGGGLAVSMRL